MSNCLWKIQARNPAYDPLLPLSGPPMHFVKVPRPPIDNPEDARRFAAAEKSRDGLDWEPTPL